MPFKRLSMESPHSLFSHQWEACDIEEKIRVSRTLYPEVWEAVQTYAPAGCRVLEAGCGLGGWLNRFQQEGYETYGVDFVAPAVGRLLRFDPALKVSVQDCTRTDFPDAFFDLYFSLGVIEHLEEGPDAFLVEARRILKPEGIGLISVPFKDFILFGPNDPTHQQFVQYEFTREEYLEVLRRNRFAVLDLIPYGYFLYPHSIPGFRSEGPEPFALNAEGRALMEYLRRHRLQRYAIMQLAIVRPET